jgi:hypothetical protein
MAKQLFVIICDDLRRGSMLNSGNNDRGSRICYCYVQGWSEPSPTGGDCNPWMSKMVHTCKITAHYIKWASPPTSLWFVSIYRGRNTTAEESKESWEIPTNKNNQPIEMCVLMATRRRPEEMSGCLQKISISWFVSCYGRSDWALTDRRLILHEIPRNSSGLCAEWRQGASARKPRFLQDGCTQEHHNVALRRSENSGNSLTESHFVVHGPYCL